MTPPLAIFFPCVYAGASCTNRSLTRLGATIAARAAAGIGCELICSSTRTRSPSGSTERTLPTTTPMTFTGSPLYRPVAEGK
jgi:hypothetical protein